MMPMPGGKLLMTVSIFSLGACVASTESVPPPPPVASAEGVLPPLAEPQKSPHDRLFDLFKASDEASLQRNPIQALFRGDLRYADRLGDLFSDQHYQGARAAAERDLAALHAISRDQLDATDQLAYDVFDYSTKDTLRGLQPELMTLSEALPMNHFFGLH